MRYLLNGGSDRTLPVECMGFNGDDDALFIATEPDHTIRRPLHAGEEPLRLFVQRVLDDDIHLEDHVVDR